jgi:hypothetical protein
MGFHLPTAFSFFVHGESTVCASLDVRRHPPVHWLTSEHLSTANSTPSGVPVILAPFGLAGTLEGDVPEDRETKKLWEEWNKYYPLEALSAYRCCSSPSSTGCWCANGTCSCPCCEKPARDIFGTPPKSSESPGVCSCLENRRKTSLPAMVSVTVGRTRFKYPSAYVLVVGDDDEEELVVPSDPHVDEKTHPRRSRDRRPFALEHRPIRRRPPVKPFGLRSASKKKHFSRLKFFLPNGMDYAHEEEKFCTCN